MRISDWSSDVCSSDLELIVSRKPTGTLVIDDLKPAKNLYLIGTGTGLAPFMSLARDPDVFERFEKVVVVHGVRRVNDLAYHDYISEELPHHEFLGDIVRDKLIYYPTVTREPWKYPGRVTALFENEIGRAQ